MSAADRPVISSVLFDESGNAAIIGPKGLLGFAPPEHIIGMESIAGASSGIVSGYVGTSATTTVAVRASTYTELGSAQQLQMVSSSASDASAGTGSRTVRITWFDGSMNGPYVEDVTLNGTTAVNTVATTMRFIEKIETLTVGSNGTNVGTLTLRTLASVTVGTVPVGDGVTHWGHHYVAAGKRFFLRRFMVGTQGVSGNLFIRRIFPLTAAAFDQQVGGIFRVITAQPTQVYDVDNVNVLGPAKVHLWYRPDAVTANTTYASMTYYEL